MTTPSNHFPIGSVDCNGSGCHSTANVNPGGFRIGAASVSAPTLSVAGHATVAVVGACSTCHEAAPYLGMMVSTATAWGDSRPQAYDKAHPASGDCNGCHTTSPTFATNQMGSSAKPANHIPTSAPCAQCHTTAGNFGAYVMGATGHAGITTNCALCHAYGLSFYNMAPPTLVQPPSGPTGHIPSNPPGVTARTGVGPTPRVAPAPGTAVSGAPFNHATVAGTACVSCHTAASGAGKPPTHIATTDACQSCHTTLAWLPVKTVDHTQVKGNCVSCHNGGVASGKPSRHLATSAGCERCHTTNAWTPARFDHAAVAPHTCSPCP